MSETPAISKLLDKIAANLETDSLFESFAGQVFEGANLIPDLLVSLIIEYYAHECQERYRTEQAKRVCRAFRAVGFRAWVQSELGWEKPQPLSGFEMIAQMAMEAAKLEKRMREAEQAISLMIGIQQKAESELKALPMAETPAPEKPARAKVNELVRNYAQRNHVSHQSVWNKLYKELYYRCHIDVDARCRNRKAAKLDVVEEAGYMEQLHAIASEILGV